MVDGQHDIDRVLTEKVCPSANGFPPETPNPEFCGFFVVWALLSGYSKVTVQRISVGLSKVTLANVQ